jgi:hypothetical protein
LNYKLAVVLVVLLCVNAQAQLRKCTGVDGKVTYSDVLCASTSTTQSVKVHENSLDTSALRQEGRNLESRSLMTAPPTECKFKAFENGDEKGKVLGPKATEECIKNIQARKEGRPTSQDAYTMWKDNFDQESEKRHAFLQRNAARQGANCNVTVTGGIISKNCY